MKDNRVKLVALIVLVVILIIALLLLLRACEDEEGTPIADTSFRLLLTIFDLRTPLGVTTDADGKIYISNTGESKVNVYTPDGNLDFTIETVVMEDDESVDIASPYGIAVDDERDKLYICDYSVYVMNKFGEYLYQLNVPFEAAPHDTGRGIRPNQVALYEDRVFITSRDGIYIFDADSGEYLEHWGTRGSEVGQYDYPNGIAIDQNSGIIYVVDTNNWRVLSLNQEGEVRWVIGTRGTGEVQSPFRLPRSVAVAPDGNIYISDIPSRIVVLDPEGNLLTIFGERGTADAELNFPEGLNISDDNRLLFADRENNRVQVWQLATEFPVVDPAEAGKFADALGWIMDENEQGDDGQGDNDQGEDENND